MSKNEAAVRVGNANCVVFQAHVQHFCTLFSGTQRLKLHQMVRVDDDRQGDGARSHLSWHSLIIQPNRKGTT